MQSKLIETIKSLLFSYALTILMLLLLSLGVYLCNFNSGIVNISIILIYILTCFFGALRLGKKTVEKRFLWGILLSACYISLLLAASVIVHHSITFTSLPNLTAIFLCLASGMLGGMVS